MSSHTSSDGTPISLIIQVGIFLTELLGAFIAFSADGFTRWASLAMVAAGLFINWTVNREKFNLAFKKWLEELKLKFRK